VNPAKTADTPVSARSEATRGNIPPWGRDIAASLVNLRARPAARRAALEDLVLVLPFRLRHAAALLQIATGTKDPIAGADQHNPAAARIIDQRRPQIEEVEPICIANRPNRRGPRRISAAMPITQ
jgi:hypothetical protein